uniref:Uncharacterized protein n=1 Tax=Chromera velia CCMP2878 TaxID=1169474 RepID=A0A0G4H6U5_9ALVE|mmetsp:Transcript_28330/g.55466  ORF Transcript_28330/g.55466 Transcript_28330/m.55466 type:complete len:433 (-) Transcript_28330:131-1429(-)|eukprot:Cvel_24939.t1-p1 / transcript=Cvel_24939.t1 / gene=Cvel_24939 / organism=Chromera_velia_CCMP2878 / gene_product=hypothetical protein / transcript_product=hypothetical protein / location=Cvel_scaffold2759:18162-20516(-) / protein_length=432 / sequence_SO=supercontig / SO=protein_coding / is_pseudo=false
MEGRPKIASPTVLGNVVRQVDAHNQMWEKKKMWEEKERKDRGAFRTLRNDDSRRSSTANQHLQAPKGQTGGSHWEAFRRAAAAEKERAQMKEATWGGVDKWVPDMYLSQVKDAAPPSPGEDAKKRREGKSKRGREKERGKDTGRSSRLRSSSVSSSGSSSSSSSDESSLSSSDSGNNQSDSDSGRDRRGTREKDRRRSSDSARKHKKTKKSKEKRDKKRGKDKKHDRQKDKKKKRNKSDNEHTDRKRAKKKKSHDAASSPSRVDPRRHKETDPREDDPDKGSLRRRKERSDKEREKRRKEKERPTGEKRERAEEGSSDSEIQIQRTSSPLSSAKGKKRVLPASGDSTHQEGGRREQEKKKASTDGRNGLSSSPAPERGVSRTAIESPEHPVSKRQRGDRHDPEEDISAGFSGSSEVEEISSDDGSHASRRQS